MTTEATFCALVLQACRDFGWTAAHFRPALTAKGWRTAVQGDGKGWPDIIAVKGDRLLAAELKSAKGKLTPEQEDWLGRLGEAGVEIYLWRPTDLAEVLSVLSGGQAQVA